MSSLLSAIKRKKTPTQLVSITLRLMEEILTANPTATPVTSDTPRELSEAEQDICKRMEQMKDILMGESDKQPDEDKCIELATALMSTETMLRLIQNLSSLPFEARKETAFIFNNVIRRDLANFAAYVEQHMEIVDTLIAGYAHPDIALNCGSMVRECTRHDAIVRAILFSDNIWLFFQRYVHIPNFEVSADAFATLRELLTRKKAVVCEFLEDRYDQVFDAYDVLLSSDNYVTRRQSLKLLGELLLERANLGVMIRFISSKNNLKQAMILLRDKSPNIQFEAFHVFKIFVANPKKPPEIVTILFKNKDRLMAYLENFHTDKDDSQFVEEKQLLISTLADLEPPEDYNPRRDSELPEPSPASGFGSPIAGDDVKHEAT